MTTKKTPNPKSATQKPATKPQPVFCASLRPEHPRNVEAAEARGLRYDPEKRSYVDDFGRLVLNERGATIR